MSGLDVVADRLAGFVPPSADDLVRLAQREQGYQPSRPAIARTEALLAATALADDQWAQAVTSLRKLCGSPGFLRRQGARIILRSRWLAMCSPHPAEANLLGNDGIELSVVRASLARRADRSPVGLSVCRNVVTVRRSRILPSLRTLVRLPVAALQKYYQYGAPDDGALQDDLAALWRTSATPFHIPCPSGLWIGFAVQLPHNVGLTRIGQTFAGWTMIERAARAA